MTSLYVGRIFTYKGHCGFNLKHCKKYNIPVPPKGGTALITKEYHKQVEALIDNRLYTFSKFYLLKEIEQEIPDSPGGELITTLEKCESILTNIDSVLKISDGFSKRKLTKAQKEMYDVLQSLRKVINQLTTI